MNIFLNLSALKNVTESGKVPFRRGAFHNRETVSPQF